MIGGFGEPSDPPPRWLALAVVAAILAGIAGALWLVEVVTGG